jgi:CPA2 family monovalent cation:H+ antiporter-2
MGLADQAFPAGPSGNLDRAAAPRRVLVTMLQLTILLLAGVPLVAVTQPFLPPFRGAAVLAIAVVVLAVTFWRSTTNLQGHVRAGVQVIAEALGKQARAPGPSLAGQTSDPVEQVRGLLPGLGEPTALRIASASAGVGRSLADLNLRGLTGATVLAITRGGQGVLAPGGHEVLQQGDVLALAGSHEAVEAAKTLLGSAPAPS